ncbi:MAG: iron ABC transporter permease [Lachnospiraceae bacterium]|nr:iron ABC transporter permease [Lachnospiraceae bacterium]
MSRISKEEKRQIRSTMDAGQRREGLRVTTLALVAICAVFFSFTVGRYSAYPSDVLRIIWGYVTGVAPDLDPNVELVFFSVRLPRVICAFLVGMGLSVAGCSYQGVFRNPMVSPDILGATAGAGFGAAIAMLLDFGILGIELTAFLMGLAAVGISYLICMIVGKRANLMLTLILAGMVVSALFQAGISLIKYVADPYTKLPEIEFWLMGSLASVNYSDVVKLLIPLLIALIPLYLFRWQLNLLAFSDEEAKMMGVNITAVRLSIIFSSTLISSSVVAVSGIIGWVGLVIPHLTRMIVGPNYKVLIPSCIFLGGAYLLLVDDIARAFMAAEIPLGILTAIVGAPFFIILLCQKRGGDGDAA